MASYLLTCVCGKTLPVDTGQAGGQVVCSCGTALDVPTLRKLRHLPLAPTDQPKPAAAWTARKGAIAVFLIVAGTLATLSLWNRLTEPKIPEFQPLVHSELVNQELQDMTPVEAWKRWIVLYRPLAENGFAIMQSQIEPAIRAQIARQRFLQAMMLIVAGICVVLAIIIAIWTRAAPRGG
jgi:hypothetical protein